VAVLSSFPALPEMLCTIGFPNSGFQFGTVLHPEPTISQVVGMVCSLSWFMISFFFQADLACVHILTSKGVEKG
jgi:hypothetical protein